MTTYTHQRQGLARNRGNQGTVAIAAAIAMEAELQPAFGVTVDMDGETVAEIRDGIVSSPPHHNRRR